MGYFNTIIKMPIAASKQHSAFSSGNVMVDWQAIQIPKGSVCLKSLTLLARPKGDSSPTINSFGSKVIFSKTNTVSLGTVGSMAAHRPNPDIIGAIEIDDANFISAHLQSTSIATIGSDNANACPPLIFTGDVKTGDNVGYDTVYVGLIAGGNFDFTSINAIAEAGSAGAASTQVITMDGTSMDVQEHFAVGDVVHIGTSVGTPAADSLNGTIASADSATQLTLESTSETDLVDGDILYNLHPITLILGFEK